MLDFTFDDLMRIRSWHFTVGQHRELIPRSVIAMQVRIILSIDTSTHLNPLFYIVKLKVATVSKKSLENEKNSRSEKTTCQGISVSVREI